MVKYAALTVMPNCCATLDLWEIGKVRAYELVKEEDRLTKPRHESKHENLIKLINRRPKYDFGGWVWINDDKTTISGGGQHVLKTSETDSRRKKNALYAK